MAKKEKKRKSPYCRYGKTPYRYSDLYNQWTDAAKKGDGALMAHLARKHSEWVARNV